MKTGTLLLLGVAGIGVYELMQLNTAANTFNLVFNGVQPLGLLKYNLQFIVQNVSNATIRLNSLSAEVTVNDYDLGNVSFFPPQPLEIGPNSQTPVNLLLQPNILSIAADAVAFFQNNPSQLDFVMNGNMNINGFVMAIPEVEKSISFS